MQIVFLFNIDITVMYYLTRFSIIKSFQRFIKVKVQTRVISVQHRHRNYFTQIRESLFMLRNWVCNTHLLTSLHIHTYLIERLNASVCVEVDFHVKSRGCFSDCSFVIRYRTTLGAIQNGSYSKAKGIIWESFVPQIADGDETTSLLARCTKGRLFINEESVIKDSNTFASRG